MNQFNEEEGDVDKETLGEEVEELVESESKHYDLTGPYACFHSTRFW